MKSLQYHSKIADAVPDSDLHKEEKILIVEEMAKRYQPARWVIPEDLCEKTHFLRVVREKVDPTSSPGYPLCLSHTTNRQLFQFDEFGNFSEERAEMVWSMVRDRLENRYSDPIRLFVKPEPHKRSKLELERYRLISSVSVVDSIIDHMLFSQFNDAITENHSQLSCKVGWSQYGGGWLSVPLDGVAMDKSSWDWTVRPWLLELVLDVRRRTCKNLNPRWEDLARWRYEQLYAAPTFVTSGGLFFRQTRPGIMKSGCVNTISDNSLMQEIIHLRACLTLDCTVGWIMTMGDDTYQEQPEDLEAYCDEVSKYCILKQVLHSAEFAGVRVGPGHVEPAYWAKHCYNLLHVSDKFKQEFANGYALFYHHSKFFPLVEKILNQLDVHIPGEQMRSLIYDGWE